MKKNSAKLRSLIEAMAYDPKRVAIASDYDGTLAPIVEDPAIAVPDPNAIEALRRLSRRAGLVAIVSGRPTEFLRKMIGIESIYYAGLYGIERDPSTAEAWRDALAEAEKSARGLLEEHPEFFCLENKGLALVLHYRRAPDRTTASQIARGWASDISRSSGLRVLEGKMNVELVPPVQLGKGAALDEILEDYDADLHTAVFIGDDVGDLEAFEMLSDWETRQGRRLAFRVAVASDEIAPELEAAADLVLESQRDVAGFLKSLAAEQPRGDVRSSPPQ
jgi:trehalose 6-phosphate phosphatase